jgi:hypothetical protein
MRGGEDLSPAMLFALMHMRKLEQSAVETQTCPHASPGEVIAKVTANALARRGFLEWTDCEFGADWPEVRLTDTGREALKKSVGDFAYRLMTEQ